MRSLEWVEEGTRLFLDGIYRLADANFAAPTGLAGWSRSHVIAHVHYNALALRRLARWAATGEPHPMYASRQQRNDEIESGSRLDPTSLRQLARDSAAGLDEDLADLSDESWVRDVVTAQGRTVPAAEIPWLRAREVAIHAVDLGCGLTFDDLPDDFVEALLVDVVRRRASLGEGRRLAAWLTGREQAAPALGPWL
jgi:maleylpyruvate isomerase